MKTWLHNSLLLSQYDTKRRGGGRSSQVLRLEIKEKEEVGWEGEPSFLCVIMMA